MTFVMIRYVTISGLYPYCLGIIYLYETILNKYADYSA